MTRTFAPGQCHHRAADGTPDCRKKIARKHVQLCPTHQAAWQKAAAERYAAKAAASPAAATPAKVATAKAPRPSTKRPPKGKVVPLTADEGVLDLMARELAAVKKVQRQPIARVSAMVAPTATISKVERPG